MNIYKKNPANLTYMIVIIVYVIRKKSLLFMFK